MQRSREVKEGKKYALLRQERSPQPPRQEAQFRLRPAANCRHLKFKQRKNLRLAQRPFQVAKNLHFSTCFIMSYWRGRLHSYPSSWRLQPPVRIVQEGGGYRRNPNETLCFVPSLQVKQKNRITALSSSVAAKPAASSSFSIYREESTPDNSVDCGEWVQGLHSSRYSALVPDASMRFGHFAQLHVVLPQNTAVGGSQIAPKA